MIPYSRQNIGISDLLAVAAALFSRMLTQGSRVRMFEEDLAKFTGAKYVHTHNSATSALISALAAVGIGQGKVVWTSPNTFVASANAALVLGASVDFVDIELSSGNICLEALEKKLTQAKEKNQLPDAVIPVHFSGIPVDMKRLFELSKKFGFRVVEDASHALGAGSTDNLVGSAVYSDVVVTSFHAVKLITTGEGGATFTNSEEIAKSVALTRSHGIAGRESDRSDPAEVDEIWNYQQVALGFNFRMTEMQAALGSSQLKKLKRFTLKRRRLARYYLRHLPSALELPSESALDRSSLHLFVVRIPKSYGQNAQSRIYRYLRSRGILVNLHYIPVHLQPYYRARGFSRGQFPLAEDHFRRSLSIPLHPGMGLRHCRAVIAGLSAAIKSLDHDPSIR